ncbi:phosphatase PAP2 family protein [Aspergillus ibericus CBS 121593]|uniref:Phosphatidic acid phosphatase n=1 Tax=Aspergillus ibericus CBS 121593 TaxID=1448316 RepID=A0A395HIE5_9EURO|nr:phosphatidic acid phosphatase [Aspergillus ibericus CBS 121593]RAL06024.1 phosphatidic acid phosphatase [Aspergillus ibericus CBS 121593]
MDRLPDKLPFSKRRLKQRVILSYIFDYVILIACIGGFYVLDSIEPFHQHFSLRNISIQYPYAVHEHITIQEALCISGLAPLIIIIVFTLFIDGLFSHHKTQHPVSGKRNFTGPYRWKDRLWELNCGILGLLLSQGLTFVITQVLKNACGKPRPDFIDRCQPRAGSEDAIPGLSNSTICTGDHALIKDGFRSWPSGHSSSSFAGLFYLSLWLSGKLHIMDNRGEAWKTLLVMIPCLAATLVAVTRIMDARHHPFDVISGSLLGIICACISYRQYFPSLSEPWKKGRAYPIRTWGREPVPPADPVPLAGTDGSTAALRNIEEERLHQGTQRTATDDAPAGPLFLPESNPYATNVYNYRRHDEDGAWSSSSEDVAGGYEMQPGYTRTQNSALGEPSSRYDIDTAYRSQTPQVVLGATTAHAPSGAVVAPPDRGRDLTDMQYREA